MANLKENVTIKTQKFQVTSKNYSFVSMSDGETKVDLGNDGGRVTITVEESGEIVEHHVLFKASIVAISLVRHSVWHLTIGAFYIYIESFKAGSKGVKELISWIDGVYHEL